MAGRIRIISGLGAEVSFTILPLLVVGIVLIHQGPFLGLFASPEWSFGAAILFGQALVKFVSGFSQTGRVPVGSFALVVALLIVFGLVPALVVNAMTVMATEPATKSSESRAAGQATADTLHPLTTQSSLKREGPTPGLQISQVLLFGAGVLVYVLLGTVAEEASTVPSKSDRINSEVTTIDPWAGTLGRGPRREKGS